MSKIHITFDDLCAFFTSKLNREKLLMVGMVRHEESAQNDIHKPIINIFKQGLLVKTYSGFGKVNGEIFLHVYDADDMRIMPSIRNKDEAELETDQFPFNKIPDLEGHLYKEHTLTVNAALCPARLFFQHGELYAEGKISLFDFKEKETSIIKPELRLDNVPEKVALDIAIPTGGGAELRFENGMRPFTFDDGNDYVAEIINAPASGEKNSHHFLHFYEIVEKLGRPRLFPVPVSSPNGDDVGPFCVESMFSKANF